MSSGDNIGATEALLENVLTTRFEDLDPAQVSIVKDRIIDLLGCVISAANAPGNPALVGLVKEWGGKPEATILAYGAKVPAHNCRPSAIMGHERGH